MDSTTSQMPMGQFANKDAASPNLAALLPPPPKSGAAPILPPPPPSAPMPPPAGQAPLPPLPPQPSLAPPPAPAAPPTLPTAVPGVVIKAQNDGSSAYMVPSPDGKPENDVFLGRIDPPKVPRAFQPQQSKQ